MKSMVWTVFALCILLMTGAACVPPQNINQDVASEDAASEDASSEDAASEDAASVEADETALEEGSKDIPDGNQDIHIVLSMSASSEENPFLAAIARGALDRGMELGMAVTVLSPENSFDAEVQASQIESLLAGDSDDQSIDGLLVTPTDVETLTPILIQALDAGIPLVFVNTTDAIDLGAFIPLIGTDQAAGAVLASQYICASLQSGDQVAVLSGSMTQHHEQVRFEASISELSNCGLAVVAEQNGIANPAEAQFVMDNILASTTDIQGFFTTNGQIALGVADSLKTAELLDDVTLVGYDASPDVIASILAGDMSATIAENPYNMGAFGVESIWALINNQATAAQIDTGTVLVTEANADNFE